MKKFITACAVMACTLSLYAKDIKEFVVTTSPKMSCENCENKIKGNLRFEKGVKKIVTDLQNQVVVVIYDADKTNEDNLRDAFGKLNYKVTKIAGEASSSVVVGTSCKTKKQSCCNRADSCANKTDCHDKN